MSNRAHMLMAMYLGRRPKRAFQRPEQDADDTDVAKHSWSSLFYDYNILAGRLWLLLLVTITLAPYVVFRVKS